MALYFQTIYSGSSGNLLTVWDEQTRLVIDAGTRSQKALRAALERQLADPPVRAVLVSHLHSDHINYSALRVLEQTGHPLYVHRRNAGALMLKHARGLAMRGLELRCFDDEPLTIGGLSIRNFETPHDGNSRNCGFVIERAVNGGRQKIVLATDFYDAGGLTEHFLEADLIYLEANHDLELLRRYPNFNSGFHLSNPNTARLLARVIERSQRPPRTVVLGHLSTERNRPELAIEAIRQGLRTTPGSGSLQLHVAPRATPSPVFTAIQHSAP